VADQPLRHARHPSLGRRGRARHRRHAAVSRPRKTLFIVIDEVSQYVLRTTRPHAGAAVVRVRARQRLRGRAWLLVTGQQKLDDQATARSSGPRTASREKLRVHLDDHQHPRRRPQAPAAKQPAARPACASCSSSTGATCAVRLRLRGITEDDFVDVYPLLPGHIDLIIQITSALRTRSSRSQGDDQAIRGLLQLLGELFRGQGLADARSASW
jgi:hypothetical protein